MPNDYISGNINRLLKETYWIHNLDILYPKGLNAEVLYKAKMLFFYWYYTGFSPSYMQYIIVSTRIFYGNNGVL